LNQIEPEELEQLLPEVFNLLYDDVFGTKEGWIVKENVIYVLSKLKEWRDQGSGPKLGIISNFDERLVHIVKDLGLDIYFDFVLTSKEMKVEKPDRVIFDEALRRCGVKNVQAAYHVGDSMETDVAGAVAAGWSPMRFTEWFDEDFPDWTSYQTKENAKEGFDKHASFMKWGRKDTATSLEWLELWSLGDILTVFGFPEDPAKPIATTYLRSVLDD
jgi:FMN phosphatase YigB (HAD superfamily)